MEERYLTVTALTKYISYKFDHDVNLEDVLLEGEISNFKRNSRGHFYFKLKDENASIDAAMFAMYASKVKIELSDGMKVFVRGKVQVYQPSGTYSINVKEIKSDGVGDLYLAFEKLKKELEALGLFDEAHKKPIPRFPKTIGVVTSPTGAAIRDIYNTVSRRYPLCHLILYPAIVQGDDAKFDIVNQIKRANFDRLCDVLIVGRGGGSIEDLWAFNEREVAEAIYNSEIPIISAVGHEINFTIADFVADKRAATPTAGAEIATPNVDVLKETVKSYLNTISKRVTFIIDNYRNMIVHLDKRIDNLNPINILNHKRELIDNYQKRLNLLIKHTLDDKYNQFRLIKNSIDNNNPLKIMDRGYSISSINGKVINSVDGVKKGDLVSTRFQDGTIISQVIEVNKNGK